MSDEDPMGYDHSIGYEQDPLASGRVGEQKKDPPLLSGALLVVSLVLVVVAAMLVLSVDREYDMPLHTPRAGATTEPHPEGFQFNIIDIDTETDLENVGYVLRDQNGSLVFEGDVLDINGLNISHSDVNISFDDRDEDLNLSAGDQLYVKSKENGGLADKGYSLALMFKPNKERIVEKTF
jgi:hypothetical protein